MHSTPVDIPLMPPISKLPVRFVPQAAPCYNTPDTQHVSRITHHASRITHHESRITHHASRITHHASRITHHASRITHHASRITHHASHSRTATCNDQKWHHRPVLFGGPGVFCY